MRIDKSVTMELEAFRRKEQMHRLRCFLKKLLLPKVLQHTEAANKCREG
jgi:hypothetical protein